MSRLRTKNYNLIVIGKLQKYLSYHQTKLTSMNILLVKKYSSSQKQIIEKSKFILSPLGEVFAKQTKTIQDRGRKQLDAFIDLNDSKKILIKAIEDKPKDKKDQSTAADIFNDLILKRK